MQLAYISSGLIALLSAFVSAPSCRDSDAVTAPTFNEGQNPRRTPPPAPSEVVVDELVAEDSTFYRMAWPKVADAAGAAQNYRVIVHLTSGDTLYHEVQQDTFLVIGVKHPPVGTVDTVLFESYSIRRGLESDVPGLARRPIKSPDTSPPPPDVIVDTIVPPDTTPPDTVVTNPSPLPSGAVAELPRDSVDLSLPAPGRVIAVPAGSDLQAAINGAMRGDVLELAPGAVFTGSFILPAKTGSGVVTIRSGGTLPPPGVRVTPASAANFATLVTKTSEPALRTANDAAAGHYRLVGIAGSSIAPMTYAIFSFGNEFATTVEQLPPNIILDRVYVHMNETGETQRCVAMNARNGAVIHSWLSPCRHKGSDSQAIIVWYGAGPFSFINNHLAGAGENLMIGGATPHITGLVPSDIIIRGNHFFKPPEWQSPDVWSVKNLFELKNSQRVLFENNVLENNWKDSQDGFAVVLKSSNDNGACYWCVTRDVTMRWNMIINSPGGINIKGLDQYNGGGGIRLHRLSIDQLLMERVGFSAVNVQSGANWRMIQLLDSVTSVDISHVTSLDGSNQIVMFDGKPNVDFRLTASVFGKTTYGIFGSGKGEGKNAIATYAPGSTITGNVFVGAACPPTQTDTLRILYPLGNTCPASAPATPGVNRAELDRRLAGVR